MSLAKFSILIALLSAKSVLAVAESQIDLRFGDTDFFIGEKFLIRLSDLIYWVTGTVLGFILYLFVNFVQDYRTLKRERDSLLRLSQDEEGDSGTAIIESGNRTSSAPLPRDKEGSSIGSNKYPTREEGRIIEAIQTEPENYVKKEKKESPKGSKEQRQGRLIGLSRVPTYMEYVLGRVDEEPENSFEN